MTIEAWSIVMDVVSGPNLNVIAWNVGGAGALLLLLQLTIAVINTNPSTIDNLFLILIF
jgi:hypothetical protein